MRNSEPLKLTLSWGRLSRLHGQIWPLASMLRSCSRGGPLTVEIPPGVVKGQTFC